MPLDLENLKRQKVINLAKQTTEEIEKKTFFLTEEPHTTQTTTRKEVAKHFEALGFKVSKHEATHEFWKIQVP